MDVCQLELPKQFDLIIIPFSSYAHLTSPGDQLKALKRIFQHLLPGGTFICTLGNPTLRKQSVDGQLRLFRKYPLTDPPGTLLLWIRENSCPDDPQVVEAMQFYEEYDASGGLTRKRLLELHFRLTSKDEFEQLARAAGFKVRAFYGDYAYAEFKEDSSPVMIWLLE